VLIDFWEGDGAAGSQKSLILVWSGRGGKGRRNASASQIGRAGRDWKNEMRVAAVAVAEAWRIDRQ
jgi:hypothetical protein